MAVIGYELPHFGSIRPQSAPLERWVRALANTANSRSECPLTQSVGLKPGRQETAPNEMISNPHARIMAIGKRVSGNACLASGGVYRQSLFASATQPRDDRNAVVSGRQSARRSPRKPRGGFLVRNKYRRGRFTNHPLHLQLHER